MPGCPGRCEPGRYNPLPSVLSKGVWKASRALGSYDNQQWFAPLPRAPLVSHTLSTASSLSSNAVPSGGKLEMSPGSCEPRAVRATSHLINVRVMCEPHDGLFPLPFPFSFVAFPIINTLLHLLFFFSPPAPSCSPGGGGTCYLLWICVDLSLGAPLPGIKVFKLSDSVI